MCCELHRTKMWEVFGCVRGREGLTKCTERKSPRWQGCGGEEVTQNKRKREVRQERASSLRASTLLLFVRVLFRFFLRSLPLHHGTHHTRQTDHTRQGTSATPRLQTSCTFPFFASSFLWGKGGQAGAGRGRKGAKMTWRNKAK